MTYLGYTIVVVIYLGCTIFFGMYPDFYRIVRDVATAYVGFGIICRVSLLDLKKTVCRSGIELLKVKRGASEGKIM